MNKLIVIGLLSIGLIACGGNDLEIDCAKLRFYIDEWRQEKESSTSSGENERINQSPLKAFN